jgi:hypothetical protein
MVLIAAALAEVSIFPAPVPSSSLRSGPLKILYSQIRLLPIIICDIMYAFYSLFILASSHEEFG